MLSSPLPLIVISPNNTLKDNASSSSAAAAAVAMNNNSSPMAAPTNSGSSGGPVSSPASSSSSSLEYKTKTLSNRVGSLRNEIQEVETKISRLIKERDERTKKANDLANEHNNNNYNNNHSITDNKSVSSTESMDKHQQKEDQSGAWKRLQGADACSDLKNHATCTVLPLPLPKVAKKTVDFSHRMFGGGNALELPKYAQPCEAPAFQANRKRYVDFKPKLVESISRRKKALNEADEAAASEYDCSYSQWINKIQSQRNSAKRRAKDAKNREFFEKIFPDLKKRREQDERIARMGTRGSGKSEFEIEEIASSLRQQELSESEMHRNAVIPPLVLTRGCRGAARSCHPHPPPPPPPVYMDNNRFIKDPVALYNQHQNISSWTPQRQKLFRDKYLMHPKNFAAVASAVGKSIEECVKFYYLKKPTENYKKQLRNNSIKKRTGKMKVARTSTPQPVDNSRPNTPNAAASFVSSSSSSHNSLLTSIANQSSSHNNNSSSSSSALTSSAVTSSAAATEDSSSECTNSSTNVTTANTTGAAAEVVVVPDTVQTTTPSNNPTLQGSQSLANPPNSLPGSTHVASAASHENNNESSVARSMSFAGSNNNDNSMGAASSTGEGSPSRTSVNPASFSAAVSKQSRDSNSGGLGSSLESDRHMEKENKAIIGGESTSSQDKVYQQQGCSPSPSLHVSPGAGGNESLFSRVVSSASAQLGLAQKSSVVTVVSVNNSADIWPSSALPNTSMATALSSYRTDVTKESNSQGRLLQQLQLQQASLASQKSGGGYREQHVTSVNSSIGGALGGIMACASSALKDRTQGAGPLGGLSTLAGGNLTSAKDLLTSSGLQSPNINALIGGCKDPTSTTLSVVAGSRHKDARNMTAADIQAMHALQQQQQQSGLSMGMDVQPVSADMAVALGLNSAGIGVAGLGAGSGIAGSTKDITAATLLHNSDKSCSISSKINKNCCPVPLCKSKQSKQRKLKYLHHRWENLTHEHKLLLKAQLGITETITKACASCYNRVTHILDPENGIDFPPNTASLNVEDGTCWTTEEEQTLQCVLKAHGCDWERLAAAIPSKSDKQLKNFYLFNRHKYDHLVREWSKSTVASRRNRIGSHSNGGSRGGTGPGATPSGGRAGAGGNCEGGGSDDTDYLTDDAQQENNQQDTTTTGGAGGATNSSSYQHHHHHQQHLTPTEATTQQMKSHILRRYQTEDQVPLHPGAAANGGPGASSPAGSFGAGSVAGSSPGVAGSCKRALHSPSSAACLDRMKDPARLSPSTPNAANSSPSQNDCSNIMNMNTMSISEIINQGINNQVSAEDLDLSGTPIMKLFKGGRGGATAAAVNANLLPRHFNADSHSLSSNTVTNSSGGGGNNSVLGAQSFLLNRSNSGGNSSAAASNNSATASAHKTSALDVMKSHIKHNLNIASSVAVGTSPTCTSASAAELKQQMMVTSSLQNKGSMATGSSYKAVDTPGGGGSGKSMGSAAKSAAEKTSPISPTPLNNSRPNSKNAVAAAAAATGVPPAPPPLLHLPSSIMAAHQENSQRKSPLVNNVDKFQHLANAYGAAAAAAVVAGAGNAAAAAASGGSISQGIPINYPPILPDFNAEQTAAAVAAVASRQQVPGLLQLNGLNHSIDFFRRERALAEVPRSSATSIKAAAPNNSELLAADYVTSQTMEAAQKNKMRNSPNNHPSVSNASVRRPEQQIVGAGPSNTSGPLTAASIAALQNLPHQALLDPQTTAYLLQNQPLLQQQLQQLCYLPPSTTKQLFVPPPAPANHHPLNWQLLTAPGASAAGVSPWPYPPGTVPPPPTTNSSLRPPNPHAFHQGLAAYPNGSTAAAVAAADYARLLAASPQNAAAQNPLLELNPVVRKILDIHSNEQQLFKHYPTLSAKELSQLSLESQLNLFNIHSANGGTPVSTQEAVNQLAAAQSKSLDASLYKAMGISAAAAASGAPAPPNGSSEREKCAAASAAAAAIQHAQASSNHLRRPPLPPELPSNPPNQGPAAVKSNAALLNSIDHPLSAGGGGSSKSSAAGGEVRIAPPVSKVPKLSPTDLRAHERCMTGGSSYLENNNNNNGGAGDHSSSQRKRPASPSGRLVSAIPNKRINGMSTAAAGDHNLQSERERAERELYQHPSGGLLSAKALAPNSRTGATASSASSASSDGNVSGKSGASNNSISAGGATAEQPTTSLLGVATSAHNSGGGVSSSDASKGAGSGGPGGNCGGGNGNSGSSYQMQKRFSDNYCPKYYRPQPMLKQSSKKDDHSSSNSASTNAPAGGDTTAGSSPESSSIATPSSSCSINNSSTCSNISSSTSFPSSAGPKSKQQQQLTSSHSNHVLQQQHQSKENGYPPVQQTGGTGSKESSKENNKNCPSSGSSGCASGSVASASTGAATTGGGLNSSKLSNHNSSNKSSSSSSSSSSKNNQSAASSSNSSTTTSSTSSNGGSGGHEAAKT